MTKTMTQLKQELIQAYCEVLEYSTQNDKSAVLDVLIKAIDGLMVNQIIAETNNMKNIVNYKLKANMLKGVDGITIKLKTRVGHDIFGAKRIMGAKVVVYDIFSKETNELRIPHNWNNIELDIISLLEHTQKLKVYVRDKNQLRYSEMMRNFSDDFEVIEGR